MILREELLKKVKLIEITTKKVVNDVLTGRYKSHFKGQGVQFSEHRQYVPGDDVRHIDWKVSARTRDPLIKKFEEERELSVLILVDTSASGIFGSKESSKIEIVTESASILAHAANQTGDKVGALFFSHGVDRVYPPRKGRAHIQRIVRDLLVAEPRAGGTDLSSALEVAGRVLKHSGIVFILSDFMSSNFEMPLRRLARKHDVIALRVLDPRESELPGEGYLWVKDPETGEEKLIDTESTRFRSWFEQWSKNREKNLKELFRKTRMEQVLIGTDGSHADIIVRYFQARANRSKSSLIPSKNDEPAEISLQKQDGAKKATGIIDRLKGFFFWPLILAMGLAAHPSRAETQAGSHSTVQTQSLPADWDSLPLMDVDFLKKPDSPLRVGDVIEVKVTGIDFQSPLRVVDITRKAGEISTFSLYLPDLVISPTDQTQASFKIGLVAPGDVQLPSLAVTNGEGRVVARTSPWIIPLVLPALSEEEQQPDAQPSAAPPRPPRALAFPLFWKLVGALLTGGLLSILVWRGYRLWKKRRSNAEKISPRSEPQLSEDEEALKALQSYRGRDWLVVKSRRELYFAISDTIKKYSGRRWAFDAAESTSDEFLDALRRDDRLPEAHHQVLRELFDRLDRVKFANQQPPESEPIRLLSEAEKYILSTRRKPEVAAQNLGGG